MKKIRIKWFNIVMALIFLISCGIVLDTAIRLMTSLASLTLEGVLLNIYALVMISFTSEYLIEEMNK